MLYLPSVKKLGKKATTAIKILQQFALGQVQKVTQRDGQN